PAGGPRGWPPRRRAPRRSGCRDRRPRPGPTGRPGRTATGRSTRPRDRPRGSATPAGRRPPPGTGSCPGHRAVREGRAGGGPAPPRLDADPLQAPDRARVIELFEKAEPPAGLGPGVVEDVVLAHGRRR